MRSNLWGTSDEDYEIKDQDGEVMLIRQSNPFHRYRCVLQYPGGDKAATIVMNTFSTPVSFQVFRHSNSESQMLPAADMRITYSKEVARYNLLVGDPRKESVVGLWETGGLLATGNRRLVTADRGDCVAVADGAPPIDQGSESPPEFDLCMGAGLDAGLAVCMMIMMEMGYHSTQSGAA
eukprot:CAMPEP_0204371926 /NCGR_PEP_ID=MMETSP0469-20131031/46872_1 /ASSEMBLY_ACC=CAM_ASM_000384 /TAXON_ID=2969 /ORGANISM="Oxyrrhis marina" /LENGTH=178 /DNA_ID=CAMNT_0051362115 /DNA_START=151 /DNA_END=687 /DNA_ORIENTATION=+